MGLELLIGLISGWLTTHIYYKINEKQNLELNKKLSKEVKDIILKTKQRDLSIKELNKLLEKKTFDKDSSDPLPFIACPKCGNKKIEKSTHDDYERDESYFIISCKKCGWSEWTQ